MCVCVYVKAIAVYLPPLAAVPPSPPARPIVACLPFPFLLRLGLPSALGLVEDLLAQLRRHREDALLALSDIHLGRDCCGEGKDLVYLQEKVCPVQKVVTMTTKWGEFKVRLITSLAATRLAVFVEAGAAVKKGQRLGHILAGSTVVLEMPDSVRIDAELGKRVIGGESLLHGGRRP